jgi:hypothetical protein
MQISCTEVYSLVIHWFVSNPKVDLPIDHFVLLEVKPIVVGHWIANRLNGVLWLLFAVVHDLTTFVIALCLYAYHL